MGRPLTTMSSVTPSKRKLRLKRFFDDPLGLSHGLTGAALAAANAAGRMPVSPPAAPPAKRLKPAPPSPPAPGPPPSPSIPKEPLPVVPLKHRKDEVQAPRPHETEEDGPSVFDILNMFRHRWFLNRDHLLANILSAQKDDAGNIIWVDFLPPFHTHLM